MNMSEPSLAGSVLRQSIGGFQATLSVDGSHAAVAIAALGVLFHVTFLRTVEVESFMYSLITLGIFAVLSLCIAHIQAGFSPLAAILRVAILSTAFNSAIFTSILVYRVFFHRLRRFPGPLAAKITRLYSAYRTSQSLQYYKQVGKWNEQYGDFIRTGEQQATLGYDGFYSARYSAGVLIVPRKDLESLP